MSAKRIIFLFFTISVLLPCFGCAHTSNYSGEGRKLMVFYSPNCHKCAEVKNKIMPEIENEFRGKIQVQYIDIDADVENYKFLLGLKEKYKSKIDLTLPVFYFAGHFLNGRSEIKDNLKGMIKRSLGKPHREGKLPAIDLRGHFQTFTALGIITAGLTDGVNPCAFTVIVFFISYLALQGYRKKDSIVIGLSFISAVFLTYFLIGLGLFNIIYSLERFLLVRKIFNIGVGALSIVLGGLSVYDLLKFRKSRKTEDMILKLPEAIKKRIHALIGWHYRKPKGRVLRPHTSRLIVTALVTGFLVSFLELVCTGQLYLPTIKFALKTTPLKLQALGYLSLYNLMFITPLLIIFLFGLLGTTSEQFSRVLKKHLAGIKIVMAILFFSLGALLIWGA